MPSATKRSLPERKARSRPRPQALHWTTERLDEVVGLGWDLQRVKLHVGAGTFQPVSSDQMGEHPMHAEEIHVSLETIEALQDGRPIWAVGTTAARTLESVFLLGRMARAGWELPSLLPQWAAYDAELPECSSAEALEALAQYLRSRGMKGYQGQTQILIAPPYRFRMVDLLMTNFHQPQSTLLLLVASGIGPVWKDLTPKRSKRTTASFPTATPACSEFAKALTWAGVPFGR